MSYEDGQNLSENILVEESSDRPSKCNNYHGLNQENGAWLISCRESLQHYAAQRQGYLECQYKEYPHPIKTSVEVQKGANFHKISFGLLLPGRTLADILQ